MPNSLFVLRAYGGYAVFLEPCRPSYRPLFAERGAFREKGWSQVMAIVPTQFSLARSVAGFLSQPSASPQVEALRPFLERQAEIAVPQAVPSRRRSEQVSVEKLEKHITDVKKNRGYLSGDTARDLKNLKIENGSELARLDPSSFNNYLDLLTALPYDKQARYVNSISQTTETLQRLQDAQKTTLDIA